jgi:hypothetical protein
MVNSELAPLSINFILTKSRGINLGFSGEITPGKIDGEFTIIFQTREPY